jgi:hypothetical protein
MTRAITPFDGRYRSSPWAPWMGVWLLIAALASTPGNGHEGSGTTEPAEVDPALIEQLRAIGYVDFMPVAEQDLARAGVTLHRADAAHPGYNLYSGRTAHEGLLLDMSGEVVHRWRHPALAGTWTHIEMLDNGDLFAIEKHGYLARLDWDSNLLWQVPLQVHHDVEIAPDGSVFVLNRGVLEVDSGFGKMPIADDVVTRISESGEVLETVSFHHMFADALRPRLRSAWWKRLFSGKDSLANTDFLHMNSIEYVDRDLRGLATRGTFLICSRDLGVIAFVDLTDERVVWSWGEGSLDGPHHPSVLPNDHLLVFDNGAERGWSRVIELDPATSEIVWEYRGDPPEAFYSKSRSGAQALPNGNVMVTEANRGRAFEVTRGGEIVWEFYSPDMIEHSSGETERATIYRMTRIEAPVVEALLARPAGGEAP